MTGQILARVLMWGFIIASVWYFSQQYRDSSPTPGQQQAMLDAARHYSEYNREDRQREAAEQQAAELRGLAPEK